MNNPHTVREALLERKVEELERENAYLTYKLKGTLTEINIGAKPYEMNVTADHLFKKRSLQMAAEVYGKLEFQKLTVRAWFQNDSSTQFRVGYFIDPLIKKNVFSLAEELGHMHYYFTQRITDELIHKFGDITMRYSDYTCKQETEQKVGFTSD